jgi:hypothetical protein
MKKQVLTFGVGALALAAAAFAGDVWKDKPYETWDQKDVVKILYDSPWAQKIQMGGAPGGPSMGGGGGRGGGANSVGSPGNGDGATNPGGASASGGRTVGGSEQPSYPRTDKDITGGDPGGTREMGGAQDYLARWISSRTIREAFARSAELDGKSPDELKKAIAATPETYRIVLISRDLRAFQAAGADALKQTIYLETKKSHEKIAPAKITFSSDPTGNRVAFILVEFPKTTDKGVAALSTDEKGVDFVAEAGKLKLKFHFDLSKMTDKEGADL